jgi:murein DD-endopeptidase MepM/ murein hydrolase activator NlpD
MADGVVVCVFDREYKEEFAFGGDDYSTLGRFVVVKHGTNDMSVWVRYIHMEKINISPNARVRAGDIIGNYGSTGRSFGAHCHVDAWIQGKDMRAASLLGLVRQPQQRSARPWPGAPYLHNVDPTPMLTTAGLFVT